MWTFIIIVVIAVGGYMFYKNSQEESETEENSDASPSQEQVRLRKTKLKEERIIDQWFTLIEGAEGKGNTLSKDIKRILEEIAVPSLKLEHKEVHLGLWSKFLKGSRGFLIAENKYLNGYRIFIGVHDYGKQLSVSWYLTLELTFLGKIMALAKVNPLAAIFFWPILIFAKIFYGGRGYVIPETMDLFDLEELRAYATTVHEAVKKATENLMSDMKMDFSKVDTKSRGFLNIS